MRLYGDGSVTIRVGVGTGSGGSADTEGTGSGGSAGTEGSGGTVGDGSAGRSGEGGTTTAAAGGVGGTSTGVAGPACTTVISDCGVDGGGETVGLDTTPPVAVGGEPVETGTLRCGRTPRETTVCRIRTRLAAVCG